MYDPNQVYVWRKSVLALLGDTWSVFTAFVFYVTFMAGFGLLMSLGPLVWLCCSTPILIFSLYATKVGYDWLIDRYTLTGKRLIATQRTMLQSVSDDTISVSDVRNIELDLKGVLGTLGLIGDIELLVQGRGRVVIEQVGGPRVVRDILEQAIDYWRGKE